jgi:hypothetical protein
LRNGNLALLLQASLLVHPSGLSQSPSELAANGASVAMAAGAPIAVGAPTAAGALYAILVYVCVSLGIAGVEVAAHRAASGVIYGRAAGVRTGT